jgi:hypothetical protein
VTARRPVMVRTASSGCNGGQSRPDSARRAVLTSNIQQVEVYGSTRTGQSVCNRSVLVRMRHPAWSRYGLRS